MHAASTAQQQPQYQQEGAPLLLRKILMPSSQNLRNCHHFSYSLTAPSESPGCLVSDNLLMLFGVAHYIGLNEGDRYCQEINEQARVTFPIVQRKKVVEFVNRARIAEIPSLKSDAELELLEGYLRKAGELEKVPISKLKMVIKVGQDRSQYYAILFHDNLMKQLISEFLIDKIWINETQNFMIKLQMVCKSGRFSDYHRHHLVSYKIEGGFLLIYGAHEEVQFTIGLIRQETDKIRKIVYLRDETYLFKLFLTISESFNKIFVDTATKAIFYYEEMQELFDDNFMECTMTNNMEHLINLAQSDPILQKFCKESSDYNFFEQHKEVAFGRPEAILKIDHLYHKLKKHAQERQFESSIAKLQERNFKVINDVRIGGAQDYEQLLASCSSIKRISTFNFTISFGPFIKIANYVPRGLRVYLVYSSFIEIFELQTLIQGSVSFQHLSQYLKTLHNTLPKTYQEIQTDSTTIILWPISGIEQGLKMQVTNLLDYCKSDGYDNQYRYLACGQRVLSAILESQINFMAKLIINQTIPHLDILIQIEKRKKKELIEGGKVGDQYRKYFDKEVEKVEGIFRQSCPQFEYSGSVLTELDQHNIAMMLGEGLPRICLFQKVGSLEREFVYFTYFEKFMEVSRDSLGKFKDLKLGEARRDLSMRDWRNMRHFIRRGFALGQKYLSVKIPFSNIILLKQEAVTCMPLERIGKSLISYYKAKIEETEQYSVDLKPEITEQYFHELFEKVHRLRFQDPRIRKVIQEVKLGYGELRRERDGRWVVLEASSSICSQVLEKIQDEIDNQ